VVPSGGSWAVHSKANRVCGILGYVSVWVVGVLLSFGFVVILYLTWLFVQGTYDVALQWFSLGSVISDNIKLVVKLPVFGRYAWVGYPTTITSGMVGWRLSTTIGKRPGAMLDVSRKCMLAATPLPCVGYLW